MGNPRMKKFSRKQNVIAKRTVTIIIECMNMV